MQFAFSIRLLDPSGFQGRKTPAEAPRGTQLELVPPLEDLQAMLVRNVLAMRSAGDLGGERAHTTELLLTLRPILRQVVQRIRARAGSLSAGDLEQVAVIAAIKAIGKYDHARRGTQSFGQFVYFRALSSCNEHIRLHSADVHISDAAAKGRTMRQARGEAGALPRVIIHSFDAPGSEQDNGDGASQAGGKGSWLGTARRDPLGHHETPTPEALLVNAQMKALLQERVRTLPQQPRELLSRVYGLDGREPQSVRVLAKEWGAPRSRLDRLLARTLEDMRQDLSEALAL